MALADDPLWYKDAVIYQVHVRGFFDQNDDGVGDFTGLTEKLDYIRSLGVSAIWIQPFYPSPLRDDGYDIAHYEGVHATYGTPEAFKTFLDEAHARGLRVITELVINHTSDQHPWFQAARHAPPGSPEREFYVWSDSDQKYAGVPIVFKDSERSNWTWDPVAGAYYWHRFFHHQPDLNFDNPAVRQAVLKVMRHWLDLGVDGMRLDAVPYLVEREGTTCAGLPETHAILKEIRRELDAHYANRMLLAEANQWPSDVLAYFGDDDECHMAFHFPLMPRLFMALRQEDRHPLSEILWQMPDIPERCQWAIFLRNHDELTLEMVSDEERDYMYAAYAADPQMRVNVGIRRRLATLMENSRPRIELLTGLLLSLPGTPVLYYGDELGMGDNIYLGDRNAVRTPMQWNADRNGGFSRADPARLYAPVIMDSVYGYQAVNVEAQERSPHSLLSWMRRIITLRQQDPTFGRGAMEILRPLNRHVFAFIRRYESNNPILVVANLSRTVQGVSLDLARYAGMVPVEMAGGVALPRVTDAPYFVTLAPFGFFWLKLQREAPAHLGVAPAPIPAEHEPDRSPLLVGPEWSKLFDGSVRSVLERRHLLAYLQRQPWMDRRASLTRTAIVDWGVVSDGDEPIFAVTAQAWFDDGADARYALLATITPGERGEEIAQQTPGAVIARLAGARKGVMHARLDVAAGRAALQAIAAARRAPLARGSLRALRLAAFDQAIDGAGPIERLAPWPAEPERATSSVVFGERVFVKAVRRLWPGAHPGLEVEEWLNSTGAFAGVPMPIGVVDYAPRDGAAAPMILAHRFVPHQNDGWRHALGELTRYFDHIQSMGESPTAEEAIVPASTAVVPRGADQTVGSYLETAATVGRRAAELHVALATPAAAQRFGTGAMTDRDVAALVDRVTSQWNRVKTLISHEADVPEPARAQAAGLAAHADALTALMAAEAAHAAPGAITTRTHGSLDLAHVLMYERDVTFIGMAGAVSRSPAERCQLRSPLEDLATLLRSLHAAPDTVVASRAGTSPAELQNRQTWARWWKAATMASLLTAYRAAASSSLVLPADTRSATALVRLFAIEQWCEEILSALDSRPGWVAVPMAGLAELAAGPILSSRPPVLS
jgi:maltose alpha-D-glucosyltransferase/alpha-amylase